MEKTSRSEVQFGSLIDLSPEELELACASTWQTSTPKQPASADSGIASLTAAVEELTKMIGQNNRSVTERFDEMEERMVRLERSSVQKLEVVKPDKVKYVTLDDRLEEQNNDELYQALEEIETLASKTPKMAKPKIKPTTFDGSTSWEDYLAQFYLIADLNGWTDEMKATYLAVSLSGPAREVLGDLTAKQQKSLKELTEALSTRFGNNNRTEMFRAGLKSRTRQKNESLPELAQAIRRLTRNAYPQAPTELREVLAKDAFVDALEDIDTKWKIKQSRPSTLNEALEIAVELEAFHVANRQKNGPQLRSVQTESKAVADLTDEVATLKAQLKKLQPPEPRRQEGCFSCGAMDHYRRDCPLNSTQSGDKTGKPQNQAKYQQTNQRPQPRPRQRLPANQQQAGNANLPGPRA